METHPPCFSLSHISVFPLCDADREQRMVHAIISQPPSRPYRPSIPNPSSPWKLGTFPYKYVCVYSVGHFDFRRQKFCLHVDQVYYISYRRNTAYSTYFSIRNCSVEIIRLLRSDEAWDEKYKNGQRLLATHLWDIVFHLGLDDAFVVFQNFLWLGILSLFCWLALAGPMEGDRGVNGCSILYSSKSRL